MDIEIIQSVLQVFKKEGETIRFEIEAFEKALNDEAPHLLDECYLVVQGMKMNLYDSLLLHVCYNTKGYIDLVMHEGELSENEALFVVSVFQELIKHTSSTFVVPQIDYVTEQAYQTHNYNQLLSVAYMYFKGIGVNQDYEKAFEFYQYLHQCGVEKSSYYLGYMYENGLGVETQIEKALQFYQQGHDEKSYERLGILHMFGQYVEQSDEKALEYFSQSQQPLSYYYEGLLYEQKREYALAFEKFFAGAKLFQKNCIYKTALYLKRGIGVELNLQESYKYFEYGYYLLDGDCAYELSTMFFDGVSVTKDVKKALHYLHQAAFYDSFVANQTLAQFYDKGLYVKKDSRKASFYIQKMLEIEKKNNV